MSRTFHGCPECGCKEMKAHSEIQADVTGSFDEQGEFVPDEQYVSEFEMNKIEDYTCAGCGEAFDRPELIYTETGPRLKVSISLSVVNTKAISPENEEHSALCVKDYDAPDGPSKKFKIDMPTTPEAALAAMEAAKAFFHTLLIKHGQKAIDRA